MTAKPQFETVLSWKAEQTMLAFQPREPDDTAGHGLQSLRIHLRDHKLRELSVADRKLEAHYVHFVISQARKGVKEAQRLARVVPYGSTGRDAQIGGCAARVYELGAEPPADDVDGRSPSVVA